MSRGRAPSKYCKYGHRKFGENLMLRPRTIVSKKVLKDGTIRKYQFDYVERVCKICLNQQKHDSYVRRRGMKADSEESNVRRQILYETVRDLSDVLQIPVDN